MNEFIDIKKEKPIEFTKVIMKCKDGKERWGVYDPKGYIYKWIFENECSDTLDPIEITHWRPI